jgi:hypothetical protein
MDLKKIIKKNIQGFKLKKSCSCGCNTCEDKRSLAPILNESIAPREILSEGLKHHITRNKPLTENVYRAGSENYFNLWAEARSLYSRGILEIQNSDDLEILTETNLGEFGILEDGTKVPLDFPIEEEIEKNKQYYKNIASLDKKGLAKKQFSDEDIQIAKKMLSRGEFNLDESKTPTEKEIIDDILNELNNLQEININNIKEKLKLYAKKGLLTLSIILSVTNSLQANNPQLAQDVLKTSIEMVNSGEKVNFYSAVIGLTQNILSNAIEKGDTEFVGYLKEVKLHYENLRDGGKGNNLSQGAKTAEKTILKFLSKAGKEKTISFIEAGKNIKTKLDESTQYFTPKVIKDKNNPNFTYINIPYPTGTGFLSALGRQTASGQEREQGVKKALNIGQNIFNKLQNNPNIEDIEITDLKNGIVQIFIVSDTLALSDLSNLTEAKNKLFKKGDIVYDAHTKTKLKVTRIVKDRIYTVPFNFPGRAEEWYKAEDLQTKSFFTESKNENKPLNKPMRDSSGGKAYKVYVRDPKTKKIKTVRFGSGGLRAKLDNPKARKAFAARHKCGQGEEKTSPKWWSCRIGRYSKLLGFKSNFTGFW